MSQIDADGEKDRQTHAVIGAAMTVHSEFEFEDRISRQGPRGFHQARSREKSEIRGQRSGSEEMLNRKHAGAAGSLRLATRARSPAGRSGKILCVLGMLCASFIQKVRFALRTPGRKEVLTV
jgi:hypothetical protein